MPYVFTTNYEYKGNTYQIDVQDAINKFPFLANKTVIGEILATNVEKVALIRRPFECSVVQTDTNRWIGIMTDVNPLKEKGIPPCPLYVALYKYQETQEEKTTELPIMEDQLIKGSIWGSFDEIARKISKEEEIRIMIETTTFDSEIEALAVTLRDAYISFEQERYADSKTSCRRILENLRNKSKGWKTVDNSESLCDKLQDVMNKTYAFASYGGPHEGVNTKDETEFILKSVASMFFYVNALLKNCRVSPTTA